ncbi:hypothetical protein HY485_02455 [Candidatus Woesearchaeota archaeon]|nr:hypothetical protein [Candidatus Woesearchaeota archaeon]
MKQWGIILIPLLFLSACAQQQTIVEMTDTPISVYFCEQTDCDKILAEHINNSENTNCALYSLTSNTVKQALQNKNARIVIDYRNKKQATGLQYKSIYHEKAAMHNKFCIIDNKIITGSYNPHSQTANNLIIIPSPTLARNYLEEFNELWGTTKRTKTKTTRVYLNTTLIENYFCPKDNCREKVADTISAANKSIHFITYSFTDDKIGRVLLEKSRKIIVNGIFDKSQINKFSEYPKLKNFAVAKKGIHHKVFIVDETTVITGSANPTSNGYTKNDENIIIIHDKNIAKEFLKEFNSLF